ncbi:serine hydrolase domain-containing protein [Dactylosporangium matsuzakiense]|uniref:Serine hydrolase n=1 Tax=Dactylosporangium matsuzakiense TaxID=53360 RepID=A0A9W6KHN7_9ACTN|nr:serine hydrolase [Dactylosporangium matsuzakiense]
MTALPLLTATTARLDELLATAHAGARVPTLVAGVVRNGALAHVSAAGPYAADRQFRLGSITKTMTAALVLALRDEGRLALDDLLYRHLPGTPVGAVTLRQLLSHAGGVQREPDGDWWERNGGTDVETFLSTLTADKVAYPPLHGFHYSNLAYGLLGAVVARLAGEDWCELLQKRILGPLELTRTTYAAQEPFARGYVVHPWLDHLREEPRPDAGAMAPAGQLWSTVEDLARWAAFLADPDPVVLAPATVAEMCAPAVLSDLDGWREGHGLGLQLWRRGDRVFVGHGGSMPGYVSALAVHRPSRSAVVGFANAYTMQYPGGLSGFALDLLETVLEHEPARPAPWRPGTPPPPAVAPLTGRWWWMGREYEAAWHDGALTVTPLTTGGAPWRFEPDGLAPDRWRGRSGENDGEVLQVRRAPSGEVVALDIASSVFTRDPWPAME